MKEMHEMEVPMGLDIQRYGAILWTIFGIGVGFEGRWLLGIFVIVGGVTWWWFNHGQREKAQAQAYQSYVQKFETEVLKNHIDKKLLNDRSTSFLRHELSSRKNQVR